MTFTLNHEIQQMVAPADTILYSADPCSPCTRGFCRKAWLSPVLCTWGRSQSTMNSYIHIQQLIPICQQYWSKYSGLIASIKTRFMVPPAPE